MKHIFNMLKVYKRDMKSITKNFTTMLIIGGLCILPSLYAWININACWNPYENTSTIPVAVVNNDNGASFNGKNISLGKEIIANLKKNHKIGWVFVNSKNANLGIIDGTYTALIEIPQDFTSNFTSILVSNPKKPEIIYKVNTKLNPVSSKITGAAENTLSDTITSEFISTINKTIFSSLNEVGSSAEKNKSNIINLKNNIININNNMDFIISALSTINSSSTNLTTFLTQMQATMPNINNNLANIYKSNEDTANIISKTQTTLNNSFNNIELNLNNANASIYKIKTLIDDLSSSNTPSVIANLNSELTNLNTSTNAISDFLQKINTFSSNQAVSNMLSYLKTLQSSIEDEKNSLNKLQNKLNNANSLDTALVSSINKNTAFIDTQLANAVNTYNNSAKTALNSATVSLINTTRDSAALITTAENLNNGISTLFKTSIDGSNLSAKISLDLKNRLLQFKDIISALSNKLQTTSNSDIIQIISILQSNPDFMGSFISSPFNIKDESIYRIPNYGSGMAPVYTVLAIWVGVLLLVSMLKTKTVPFDGSEKISIREKHFGKMLTFITLSLIQSFIAAIGDKLIVHVYTSSTILMLAFALVSGVTFCIIVYTLVSVFGNIGKALCIIFLIIQIAGSGSTYPIQVDPLFFRILQPLLPFTYSVGGFREAIAGPLVTSVALDFIALILISTVFILFGFFFKLPLNKVISKFETDFEKSGVGE